MILCPECGKCLACLYDLFLQMRQEKICEFLGETHVDVDPTFLSICESEGLQLGDILDKLGLETDCCRGHMIAQVEISEY